MGYSIKINADAMKILKMAKLDEFLNSYSDTIIYLYDFKKQTIKKEELARKKLDTKK